MSYLRLAAAQLNTVVGDLSGNVERVLAAVAAAEAAGADICVVPELAIPGYPPEDLLLKPTFVADNVVALEKVAAATGQCAIVVGYVGTSKFRPKAAYETTVETTIYCAPEAVGKNIGKRLYAGLFDALKGEDIHRYVAGYTLPNDASEALHRRFGFKRVGVFSENGRKFGKYWDVCWTERAA